MTAVETKKNTSELTETATGETHSVYIALMLHALSNTLVIPILPAFLVNDIAGPSHAATQLVFVSVLSGLIVTVWTGRVVNKVAAPRTMTLIALTWLAAGSILMAVAQTYTQALVIGFVFVAAFHVPSAMLFGVLKTQVSRRQRLSRIGSLRSTYIAGSICGPLVGGVLWAHDVPFRGILCLQALGYIVTAGVVFWNLSPAAPSAAETATDQIAAPRALVNAPIPLTLLLCAISLLLMGDTLRVTTLPLILVENLSAPPWHVGMVMSFVPLIEIPMLLIVLAAANRFGELPVVLVGALAGTVFFTLLPLAEALWQVVALQGVYAMLRTSVMGAGMSLLFALHTGPSTSAASLQFAAQQTAVLLGSMSATYLINTMGLVLPYFAFAGCCGLALICVIGIAATRSKTC